MCLESRVIKTKRGPAIGYRAFDIGGTGGVHSMYNRGARAWPRTGAQATADNPRLHGDHGFHAFATLAAVRRWRYREVYAKVRGTGIVVYHRNGHRASRVQILRFYVNLIGKPLAQFRRRYPGIPVERLP